MPRPSLAPILIAVVALGCGPDEHWDDAISGGPRDAAELAAAAATQRADHARLARDAAAADKTILFGDLHVHSSYSWDGFLFTLPVAGGDGAHPPADACDFARYCAELDFFALTDHAETLLPEHWAASRESLRQCNALAGDPEDPDLVAFTGFEWSQIGTSPENHWGHRCLVFRGGEDDELPARPIGAGAKRAIHAALARMMSRVRWLEPTSFGAYTSFTDYMERLGAREVCPAGVDTRELPLTCEEVA
ncbi:MAG TPA: hypothetical protein VKB65_00765, partial [Myxococcota bacterium]|nr:hypothetical protein [Myxococcota bacterium]